MSGVRIMQNDDPHRAISVQNPMSINDLMVSQGPPRRLSTGAVGMRPPPSHRRGRTMPLPPQHNRSRAPAPPPAPASASSMDNEVDPEEMGYDLILNERKKKRDEHYENPRSGGGGGSGGGDGGGGGDDGGDDELWNEAGQDDYVNPREREVFEREHGGFDDGSGGGPSLPPATGGSFSPNPTHSFTPPRRLSARHEDGGSGGGFIPPMGGGGGGRFPSPSDRFDSKPFFEEDVEKRRKYLEGLDKFRRRGMNVKHFDSNAPLDDIEMEYNRHKRAVDVEASIQFSRKMLMACVTGLEYLNSRFDPLGLHLDGWSESVIEDIHNYDDVFERLYDKYHTSVEMAPEFELLLMVAGSAFMYHLTNSMFKSAMPGMGNPEMMKNVRRGVMGAMSGAFKGAQNGGGVSGMMGGMFGGGGGGGGGLSGGGRAPSMSAGPPRRSSTGPRREMRGPSQNMDDLLNNLMDREPGEVSNRLVEEIDDILNNPSDDERPGSSVRIVPAAGPGGSPAIPNNAPVLDI